MGQARVGVVIHEPLRSALFSRADVERLSGLCTVVWAEGDKPLDNAAAAKLLEGCSIGVGSWGTPGPTAALLPQCPSLRAWIHAAGTVKGFFGPHLDGRELTIATCAPAIAECVAQHTIGCLIVGLKRILENGAANRAGKAGKPANATNLSSSTIGVVAASEVGKHVIRLLQPFGCRVLVFDPFLTAAKAAAMGAEPCTDLTQLCRESHAVTLHTPRLPSTLNLIGPAQLQAMRDDAVFVNTSRGECVDEAALIAELQKGRLFAFLDVTSPEPAAPDSPLRRLPNVVYTSHIAGGPDFKIGRQAVDDVAAILAGRAPRMAVTKDMLERMA